MVAPSTRFDRWGMPSFDILAWGTRENGTRRQVAISLSLSLSLFNTIESHEVAVRRCGTGTGAGAGGPRAWPVSRS